MPRNGRPRPPLPLTRLADGHPDGCSRCGIEPAGRPWPLEADSLRFCTSCVRQMVAGWKPRSDGQLRRKYDIGLIEFGRMYLEQGGLCAICRDRGRRTRSTRRTLHVDHDHATGAVRALLCGNCNAAIGLLGEDPAILASAMAYLARHQPSSV